MVNDDLISRAAAMNLFIEKPPEYYHTSYIVGELNCLPSVNAVPVIYAHWEEELEREREWHCSNCGTVQGITCIAMDYCPHCGARMAEHPWLADGTGQAFSPD